MRPPRPLLLGPLITWALLGPALGEEPTIQRFGELPGGIGSIAVRVESTPLAHTAQILPLDSNGNILGAADISQQTEAVLEGLDKTLSAAKTSLDRAVKLNFYVADEGVTSAVEEALRKRFPSSDKPAVSLVETGFATPGVRVAADAVAATQLKPEAQLVIGGGDSTRNSPVGVLPVGSHVYVAGQAENGILEEAVEKTLVSLKSTLAWLGLDLGRVIQIKTFIGPPSSIPEAERIIRRFFGEETVPPLVFVEWKSSLPVEIELIAWGGASSSHEPIEFLTPPGMSESPVFSRVTRVNAPHIIYVPGLTGPPGESAEIQLRDIFKTLQDALRQAGSDLRHLAKATYYVSDDAASSKLNQIRPDYYDPKRPPAASKAMVIGTGRAGRTVTLDMLATSAR